jgi:cephalosporin-C deacetylase-like acetyl esterase
MSWKTLTSLAFLFLFGTVSAGSPAQQPADKPSPGDEMICKYLCTETDKLSGRFLDGATTLEAWEKKRPRLRQEYMDMLGLWPLPEKTPLKATITGTLEHEGVVIDKLHFQSKPGLYVTASLYRPKNPPTKKLPAILYVCGHANRGRDGNKSAYQDHGMWFASNGYLCLMLDSLQLGEIAGIHHGTYGIREKKPAEVRRWWHSAGYTPAGVECWNGVRAIDYLFIRPDVDPDRIGVTGISGGGAATFWIAAADQRAKVAVPVGGMSDLQSYVKDKIINGHCDCMFLYNTYQWDWTTIAALIAPRPMLFANSDKDAIFPMDGNRRVFDKLHKVYTLYGKPELLDEHISKGGHDYRPDLRIAVFRFLNKHLKNDTTSPVKDAQFRPIPGNELRVFPTDADTPKDALNGRIDETFVPRAEVKLPEKGKFEEWKKEMIRKLRTQVFRAFPDRISPATMKEKPKSWESWQLNTESNIVTQSVLIQQSDKNNPTSATLVVWDDKDLAKRSKDWPFDEFWVQPFVRKQDPAAFIATRGALELWDSKSPPNYVNRSHALLGRTVDQGRVWDICAEAAWYRTHDQAVKIEEFRVVGKRQAGIIAAYAALLEPSIKEVVIIDPPTSHLQGPHFLGVMRVLDIPEALGLLVPTALTLINAKDKAFDRTAEIYRLAGAADKLTRK